MSRILVVDDEAQLRKSLRINLAARDYEVIEADDGRGALRMAADRNPDLVLLDLGLPDLDGIDVITALRGWSRAAIVVLTVRDDEAAKVAALDAGADDYVTKPFGMNELLARIRASLRRTSADASDAPTVATAAFTIDLAARTATSSRHGDVRLTPTEWSIVEYLARHADRLVTRRQLVTAVWGPAHDPDPNLLRVHMNHIRAKLEPAPSRPQHFLTEPGMGFRFTPGPPPGQPAPSDTNR